MATKARQQYFADEQTLQKQLKEFSIADDVQQKIDSVEEGAQVNVIETIRVNGDEVLPDVDKAIDLTIPGVVDSLDSTSRTDALSARQGKVLYDYITDVSHIGHFLALWDASTGLPITNPDTSPYVYNSGDFYTVSVVAPQGGTNYKPDGTEFIIGQASTTVETDDIEVNDFYFYDGANWRHMKNSGAGAIAIDTSLSTTSTNPVENRVITNAINSKADATDINTKTFRVTGTDDIAGLQAAYDYFVNGGRPIIIYGYYNTPYQGAYIIDKVSNVFQWSRTEQWYYSNSTESFVCYVKLRPTLSGNTVTGMQLIFNSDTGYLDLHTDYLAPYTPLYDGSPATKRYVDEKAKTYTAGENIQISSNNVISATDTTYVAGDGISIEEVCGLDTMGPCLNGFHIGTTPERENIIAIWMALSGGNSGTNFGLALKMPFTGRRNYYGSVDSRDNTGYYWTATARADSDKNRHSLILQSGSVWISTTTWASQGGTIRPLKNKPVVPDNTWTKLYGTSIAEGGIFWSASEGLISLSSDGTDWVTIADKNLGATQVWNSGDTLSGANCGYFYQWGNNYGFPGDGSVTTSYSQVDASSYGPGNYYSSSAFIYNSNGKWDTSDNKNLWGGESKTPCKLQISAQAPEIEVDDSLSSTSENPVQNKVIKSALDGKQDKLTAGDNITIENVCVNVSDMQGPAPDGFHIPLQSEWVAVKNIWTALGGSDSDGEAFGATLKMPRPGQLSFSDGSIYLPGNGAYWSSSYYGAVNEYASTIYFNRFQILPYSDDRRAYGQPIRAFKNTSVTPDSSWTMLYGTSIAAGGIFRSATEGLISLSSDGQTWVTMADKNLGATVVWNDGDTLSQNNSGNFYQWGNNYGFPYSGSVTTSSTQVDASGYGPGNYYESDTFIIGSDDWSSVQNNNLWGGVSQGSTQECALTISAQVPEIEVDDAISSISENPVQNKVIKSTLDGKVNIGLTKIFDNTEVEIGKWVQESGMQSSGHHVTINPSGEVTTYNATVGGWNEATLGSANLTLLENTVATGDETTVISQDGITITEGQTTKTYNFLGNDRIATLSDVSGGTTQWGNIVGNISSQTDLQNALSAKADATDVNTKTFTLPSNLSSQDALTVAQEAFDWYLAGKTPIIRRENDYRIYICIGKNQSGLISPISYWLEFHNLRAGDGTVELANYHMPSFVADDGIRFTYDNTTNQVTQVTSISEELGFLPTNSSAEVVYTPSRDWDPATKGYVDDNTIRAFVYTQTDYDALPSGKESDNNIYIIVKRYTLLSFEELVDLDIDEIYDELNSNAQAYYDKFLADGHIYSTEDGDALSDDGESLYRTGVRCYYYDTSLGEWSRREQLN